MIRVLRVIEYEYDTAEQFAHDRLNWTDHLQHRNGRQPRMQSSIVSITATAGEMVPEVAE